jgi:hypothetical protein
MYNGTGREAGRAGLVGRFSEFSEESLKKFREV